MGSGNVWETVHVLFASTDKSTGAISAHIGDVVSGEGTDDSATVMQHWGFLSLPAAADAGVAGAECIALKTSGPDIIIAGRDVRSAYIAGLIQPGETSIYASGSQACTLYKLKGSIVHFTTTDNTKDGRSIYSRTYSDSEEQSGGHEWVTPYGRLWFDATGFHITHASGGTLTLGAIGGLPHPFDTLGSIFSVSTSIARIEAAVAHVGPDTGLVGPALRETPTQSLALALGQLSASLTALSGSLTAIVAPGAFVAAGPLPVTAQPALTDVIATAQTSITSASTAIAALTPQLLSTSTGVT